MPEYEIATSQPGDAFEQTTSGTSVTGAHVVADVGKDKEAVELDARAGASSTAAPNSGIPSAQIQHQQHSNPDGPITEDQDETAAPGHVINVSDPINP